MSEKLIKRLIQSGVILVVSLAAFFIVFDIVNIEGYEVGVVHKWVGGVQDEPLRDGMHVVFAGSVHKINIGTQKLSFAPQVKNDTEGEDSADNEFDKIQVACGKDGGQKVDIILTVVYSLEPKKAVDLYRDGIHKDYSYKVMKRTIIDIVNQLARAREALDIYSGEGFNKLRIDVDTKLKAHPVLASRGIIIENATIYNIALNKAYEDEIEKKQLAKQMRFRAIEEALAAVEMAKKAKAEAQVMVEQRRAEAQAKKIEVVTKAEGDKEQAVLAAEAKAKQVTLAAEAGKEKARLSGEGEKLRMTAQAEGERALGLAQAEVEQKKKMAMYDGEAGKRRATVEVAGEQASKLKGILAGVKVIPKDAFVALMHEGAKMPLSLTDVGIGAGVGK